MHGTRLSELDAQDMLDVIHYMIEDDLDVSTNEQSKANSKIRVSIYDIIYGDSHNFATIARDLSGNTQTFNFEHDEGLVGEGDFTPFDPSQPESGSRVSSNTDTKKYVPPTQFDPSSSVPFGEMLDSPMN